MTKLPQLLFLLISPQVFTALKTTISQLKRQKNILFRKKNSVFIEAKSISKKQFENTDNQQKYVTNFTKRKKYVKSPSFPILGKERVLPYITSKRMQKKKLDETRPVSELTTIIFSRIIRRIVLPSPQQAKVKVPITRRFSYLHNRFKTSFYSVIDLYVPRTTRHTSFVK